MNFLKLISNKLSSFKLLFSKKKSFVSSLSEDELHALDELGRGGIF